MNDPIELLRQHRETVLHARAEQKKWSGVVAGLVIGLFILWAAFAPKRPGPDPVELRANELQQQMEHQREQQRLDAAALSRAIADDAKKHLELYGGRRP